MRLEVGAWGQDCELNMGSRSSLAPAEDSGDTCPSGALSPLEQGHQGRVSAFRDANMGICKHTHTHVHKTSCVVCGSVSERQPVSPGS